MGEVDVQLQLRLQLLPPVNLRRSCNINIINIIILHPLNLVAEPLPDPPVCVALRRHRFVLAVADETNLAGKNI